jgi:hypothetical protein
MPSGNHSRTSGGIRNDCSRSQATKRWPIPDGLKLHPPDDTRLTRQPPTRAAVACDRPRLPVVPQGAAVRSSVAPVPRRCRYSSKAVEPAPRRLGGWLSGGGHGVRIRPGQGRIEHRVLGLFGCDQSEVDGVEGVTLGPLGVALSARDIVLGFLLLDALPDVLDVLIPAAVQLVPVRFSLLGRLLGRWWRTGRRARRRPCAPRRPWPRASRCPPKPPP